ncbi:hypothetical protein BJ875DRAFT_10819 [Amylocarpus encephaloides]|uniref:Uncharacterized protein n=1 Tax=Amylocarpus encephaloides TaxID=45428 RepID=A0A9P8C5B6_9HELO|nr:hypothetical protein BJ875DRAFT_10819 [Amylocarpus encephaloides]
MERGDGGDGRESPWPRGKEGEKTTRFCDVEGEECIGGGHDESMTREAKNGTGVRLPPRHPVSSSTTSHLSSPHPLRSPPIFRDREYIYVSPLSPTTSSPSSTHLVSKKQPPIHPQPPPPLPCPTTPSSSPHPMPQTSPSRPHHRNDRPLQPLLHIAIRMPHNSPLRAGRTSPRLAPPLRHAVSVSNPIPSPRLANFAPTLPANSPPPALVSLICTDAPSQPPPPEE